ncbi:MAG: valine--tRNA ligase [Candidatus Woesearchaeota archaeon]
MSKRYQPQEAEPRIQAFWQENDTYVFSEEEGKEVFSIDTPPPTLSGRMHLGHAFSYAQGDFIARYKRMRGYSVFYPFGTDDNGLPTERLVEKQQKISSKHMPRDEFVKIVNQTLENELDSFTADWKRLAISADFTNAYSTIDAHCVKTSQLSFLDLYEKGLLKRKADPVSWCPKCQTAIAQAEFESVEKPSKMNTVTFTTTSGNNFSVMTTRPELIPACVAMAAHPKDKRYNSLDEEFVIPLANTFPDSKPVPLVFDESVDFEKGTGLMMVCTFGDKEDVEKWRKHGLNSKFIMQADGKLNEQAGPYEGLKAVAAREAILTDLEQAGLLTKQEAIVHASNVHERCATPIEYLSSKQWFVNVLDFKEELLAAGKEITWYPQHMRARFEHWVQGLSWNWIISRQRSYGVPFPVWYTPKGEVVVASKEELPIDPTTTKPKGYENQELIPERDVMDTWATSSVTPQIALGWAEDEKNFSKRFPMSLRLQAHDIIRTWAFYTILKSLHHHNTLPWRDIVISGHALDPKGKKMSKSKGNVIDPNKTMDEYSSDAVRFWAASTKLGEDLSFQEKDLITAKKTITKLFNASKFASMHLEDYTPITPDFKLELFDAWIFTRFNEVVRKATKYLDVYEYSKTRAVIDTFFWNDFCDNYLELVKDRLYNPGERGAQARLSAQFTLYEVVLGINKLFAPIMPHITEELYQLYFTSTQSAHSIHVSEWPTPREEYASKEEAVATILIDFLAEARKFKSERQLSMRAELTKATITLAKDELLIAKKHILDWQKTAGVRNIVFVEGEASVVYEE